MANANPDQPLYTIVKGRFKAIDTNTYGLFLIFLNNNLRAAENVIVIASHFSSMYETDPRQNWNVIEDQIMNLRWKGEFATSISRDTQTYTENAFKGLRSEELYTFIRSNAVGKIENLIASTLTKPLGDKNIHIELSWDNASAEQIQSVKQERELKDAAELQESQEASASQAELEEGMSVDDGSVVLDVSFVLAPVSGIPIFELQPNDRIMVKINPESKRGMYFIELLNAKHGEQVVPVPATVTEIKLNKSNEYIVLLKIGEGIYGKVIEAEQVKIKRFDPNTDKKSAVTAQKNLAAAGFSKVEPVSKEDKSIRNLYWLMYLGGFVVLAVIMLLVVALI